MVVGGFERFQRHPEAHGYILAKLQLVSLVPVLFRALLRDFRPEFDLSEASTKPT